MVMAVFSPLAGKLSDRIEPRVIASLGMALTTLGLILLALITNHTTLLYIVISLMVLGFGFALFSSPNMNAIMSSVAKKYYGIASGSVGTMRGPLSTADQKCQNSLYNFRLPVRGRHLLLTVSGRFKIR